MSLDIEAMLGRELHDVADSLEVPPMPALPDEPPERLRHRPALLVAAVVVLIVACALVIDALGGGGDRSTPAPARPTTISRAAPTTPYVLDRKLYVDGRQVPGDWVSVQYGDAAWVAWRRDDTWWWGRDTTPREIQGLHGVPVISPNGRYIAAVDDRRGVLTGFETTEGSEGFGEAPIELGNPSVTGDPVHVRAVTDDGRVIAQGAATSVLWQPLVDGDTYVLPKGRPRTTVLGNTPAGLVVTDGAGGPPYLADITDAGGVAGRGVLPDLDSFVVSPGAQWLAWTPPGTFGGEVTAVPQVEVQRLDGTDRATLRPPAGWDFAAQAWSWEDDEFLVSPVVSDDGGSGERLVRCRVATAQCVLIRSP